MKRVLGWSGFALGCHAQTIQEREREREREAEKHQSIDISKGEKRMVPMHEKCMIM